MASQSTSTDSTCAVVKEFSWGVQLGHVFIVQSAALSVLVCSLFLVYIGYNGLRNKLRPPAIGQHRWYFLRTPVDHYLLSLFVSDIILAVGCLMHIKWISSAGLTEGAYCTAQGAIKQVGNVAVSLSSLAIAVHTFLVLFFRWRPPSGHLLPAAVVGLIWVFIILITVIPSQKYKNSGTPYYGRSIYWCWIDEKYEGERIGLEYGILWFVALVNFLLYVPLFFCLRGNLIVSRIDENNKLPRWKISWKFVDTKSAWRQGYDKRPESAVIARQMLYYPVVYFILIAPMSIVRLIQFGQPAPPNGAEKTAANTHMPSEWTAFAGIFWAASGFVNILLYILTRPALFPSFRRFRERREEYGDRRVSMAGGDTKTGQVTMMSFVPPDRHHRGSIAQSPRNSRTLPVPMLVDDDDESRAPVSPARHGGSLTVPAATYKSGRSSESSFREQSISTDGHDVEKNLPSVTR